MVKLKKKVKKRLAKIFLLIIVLGGLFGAYQYYQNFNGHSTKVSNAVTNPKNDKQVNSTKPEENHLSLLATGDGLIHNLLAMYAEKGDGTYDFKPYLTEVKDIVQKYDIAYYNQETPLSSDGNYTFFPTFNIPSAYGDAMVDAGFNLVSLASNHSFDKKETGVLNSLAYWRTKKGVTFNGIADSEANRQNYQIAEKNGITYAMLSYTYGTNGITVPSDKKYLVSVYDSEMVRQDIAALRDKVDVLIVAMHWGVEYQFEPTQTQKDQAAYLASLGVDIIIGNHPHCIEPIVWLDDTLVIYSLGNFISNQIELYDTIGYKGTIGAFATLDITKKDKDIKLDNLKVDLLYTYRNKTDKYYKVVPFSKINEQYLPNYQEVYNEYKAVIQKYDPNITVVPAA